MGIAIIRARVYNESKERGVFMSVCSAADRAWIEEKYHKKSEPFDPFRRMAYHGHDFDVSSGKTDAEIKEGLRVLAKKNEGASHPVVKARAVDYVLQNTRIEVSEHDWFVGIYSLNRLITETTVRKWRHEIFDGVLADKIAKMNALNDSCALTMGPDFDHVVPDWDSVMTLGITGLRERARAYRRLHEEKAPLTEEQVAFFDGIEEEYTALIAFFDRLYHHACAQKHEKSAAQAACLLHLRDGAPTDFYEALQLLFIFALVCECVDYYQMRSLGNGLDHTLYPFWENDLKNGRFTREQLREFLAHFMLQFSAIGNYWGHPFYLGGTDEQGNTRVSELSYEILYVYDELNIYSPKIQIKYAQSTPDAFVKRALDMVRRRRGAFTFCCESAMIRAMMRYGATLEEARTADIRGCFELGVRANEVAAEGGTINAAGVLLLALYNGIDPKTGKEIGIKTGDMRAAKSFDEIWAAFLSQLDHLIDTCADIDCGFEPYFAYINPSSMYSATVKSSLENAKDGYCGGVKYNNSSMLISGLATAVDGLFALRYLVFEKKLVTLPALLQILQNNWQDAEELRTLARKCPYKYGTGEPEVDALYAEIASHFAARVNGRPNGRGGVFKASLSSAREFIWQGERTIATPDGRYSGAETAKNATPTPGMDTNGITALIRSATAFPHDLFPETCVLDAMLPPSAVAGESGLDTFKALLDAYATRGGMVIQFNIVDAKTLRDAQKTPERYRNLQVRVAGWNALWNNISKKEQDAYILRAENVR